MKKTSWLLIAFSMIAPSWSGDNTRKRSTLDFSKNQKNFFEDIYDEEKNILNISTVKDALIHCGFDYFNRYYSDKILKAQNYFNKNQKSLSLNTYELSNLKEQCQRLDKKLKDWALEQTNLENPEEIREAERFGRFQFLDEQISQFKNFLQAMIQKKKAVDRKRKVKHSEKTSSFFSHRKTTSQYEEEEK